MNTKLFLIIGCLVFTISTYSQRFRGGLMAGFNASQVDGDTYFGYNKFGLMGGVYVYTPVSKMFDLQLEIKYMGKGAHQKAKAPDFISYTSQLNYVEIPVLLRFNMENKVGLFGGLGFGYLFSYTQKDEYGVIDNKYGLPFKPFELSWILGINYKFAERFTVDLRFSYSILPVFDSPDGLSPYYRFGGYNNLFSTGLFYRLGK